MTNSEKIKLLTKALKLYANPDAYNNTLVVTKINTKERTVTLSADRFEIGSGIKWSLDEGAIARKTLKKVGVK